MIIIHLETKKHINLDKDISINDKMIFLFTQKKIQKKIIIIHLETKKHINLDKDISINDKMIFLFDTTGMQLMPLHTTSVVLILMIVGRFIPYTLSILPQ